MKPWSVVRIFLLTSVLHAAVGCPAPPCEVLAKEAASPDDPSVCYTTGPCVGGEACVSLGADKSRCRVLAGPDDENCTQCGVADLVATDVPDVYGNSSRVCLFPGDLEQ